MLAVCGRIQDSDWWSIQAAHPAVKSEKVLALHPLPLDRDLLLDGLLLHTEWSLGQKRRKLTSKHAPSSYLHNFVISSYLHSSWWFKNPCSLWHYTMTPATKYILVPLLNSWRVPCQAPSGSWWVDHFRNIRNEPKNPWKSGVWAIPSYSLINKRITLLNQLCQTNLTHYTCHLNVPASWVN